MFAKLKAKIHLYIFLHCVKQVCLSEAGRKVKIKAPEVVQTVPLQSAKGRRMTEIIVTMEMPMIFF